jgi:hypothetical protein
MNETHGFVGNSKNIIPRKILLPEAYSNIPIPKISTAESKSEVNVFGDFRNKRTEIKSELMIFTCLSRWRTVVENN